MPSKKKISILGVTGSVGQSTQELILHAPDQFDVQLVTAGSNAEGLANAAKKLKARNAIIANPDKLNELNNYLEGTNIKTSSGPQAIVEAAAQKTDLVVAAIVGMAGLRPILSALQAGINVAIANKEPLVAAGPLVIETSNKTGAKILPVDSEHNAIFQVFEEQNRAHIEKIILTASGGPFLHTDKEDIDNASLEQALAHPNWSMGQKISIDSATMMNKALEIIEAHYLFNMPPEKIDVLIHPQSIIHSLVSYSDGSFLAQLGASDMKIPIAYALAWPQRMENCGKKLDFTTIKSLSFEAPDTKKFPALTYAYEAMSLGQGACVSLNAANEVAVQAYLKKEIRFSQITASVRHALDWYKSQPNVFSLKTVDEIEELDNTVRTLTRNHITENVAVAKQGKTAVVRS